MSGIDWATIGEPTFVDIVDTLLSYEYGERGQPVEGRGGEGATPGDFSADDGKIVFEYKYFPSGFPKSSSRPTQIKRSFKAVCDRRNPRPEQWILVVPTKLTPSEKAFVRGLAGSTGIKIDWRDKVWLNKSLIDRPELATYYRHRSNDQYLMDRAALLTNSALVTRPGHIDKRVAQLIEDVGDANPHWGWDISASHTGAVTRTLVAKHANAQLLAPVNVSFGSLLPADSTEALELRKIGAFGQVVPVTIPGDLVKDFTVTGPEIVADSGPVGQLVVEPPPPGEWVDITLTLTGAGGAPLGTYLTRGQYLSHGPQGLTLKIVLTSFLTMIYRIPYEAPKTGGADFSMEDVSGGSIQDVYDATDFAYQLTQAERLHIGFGAGNGATVDMKGRLKPAAFSDYKFIRDTADDLLVIERHTKTKFRYPETLDSEDRVAIRNLRLMFEGHWVAHPFWTGATVHLSGDRDPGLDAFLTDGLFWLVKSSDEATLSLLGNQIQVKNLCYAGIFTINPDDLRIAKAALERGDAAGKQLRLQCRPGDRLRMLISADPSGLPQEIEPWNLDGFTQKGLRVDGTPLEAG